MTIEEIELKQEECKLRYHRAQFARFKEAYEVGSMAEEFFLAEMELAMQELEVEKAKVRVKNADSTTAR